MLYQKEKAVSEKTVKFIKNLVFSEGFSYTFSREKPLKNFLNKKYKTDETFQLVHILYKKETNYKSIYFDFFKNLFNEIVNNVIKKDVELLRMKINLLCPKTNKKINGFHTDYADIKNFNSMIYYINNSDGDTIIYNKKIYKIKPKAGKIVMFNGEFLHASNNPIKNNTRVVCNINFKNV